MKRILHIVSVFGIFIIIAVSFTLLPTEKEVLLLPDEKTDVVYDVYSNRIELTIDFIIPVVINISEIDSINEELHQVVTNLVLSEKVTQIKFNSTGFFLFEIVSPQFIQLSFRDVGLRTATYVGLIFCLLLRVVIWFLDLNLLIVNPLKV